MTSAARFDLKMAAEEKAQVLLQREARVMLSERDFSAFARALNSAFGLIRLHWSALILEELSRALVDTGRKVDAQAARRHEQLLRASLPHAEIAVADVDAQLDAV